MDDLPGGWRGGNIGGDHSRGVGGAGGRGTRKGGSSAPHWGRGRAVTSSRGMGSLEEKIEVKLITVCGGGLTCRCGRRPPPIM